MSLGRCDQCGINVTIDAVSIDVSTRMCMGYGRTLQLFAMRVAVLELLRRVVIVPVGGDLPLVASIQAEQLSLVTSVAISDSRWGR
jgi:hypothetical protein